MKIEKKVPVCLRKKQERDNKLSEARKAQREERKKTMEERKKYYFA